MGLGVPEGEKGAQTSLGEASEGGGPHFATLLGAWEFSGPTGRCHRLRPRLDPQQQQQLPGVGYNQLNTECQPSGGGGGCVGYSDDAARGGLYPNVNVVIQVGNGPVLGGSTFYQVAQDRIYNWVNPISAPAIGNTNSPLYRENNTGATVNMAWRANMGINSGSATWNWSNSPPTNHGCCQQLTLNGGTTHLNGNFPTVGYRNDGVVGYINGTYWYDLRWNYDHELGHTMGMGHTVDPGGVDETMYQLDGTSFYPEIVYAGPGDRNGLSCIYQGLNCG